MVYVISHLVSKEAGHYGFTVIVSIDEGYWYHAASDWPLLSAYMHKRTKKECESRLLANRRPCMSDDFDPN